MFSRTFRKVLRIFKFFPSSDSLSGNIFNFNIEIFLLLLNVVTVTKIQIKTHNIVKIIQSSAQNLKRLYYLILLLNYYNFNRHSSAKSIINWEFSQVILNLLVMWNLFQSKYCHDEYSLCFKHILIKSFRLAVFTVYYSWTATRRRNFE